MQRLILVIQKMLYLNMYLLKYYYFLKFFYFNLVAELPDGTAGTQREQAP